MKNIVVVAALTVAIASPAMAAEHFKAGDILIRARALNVCQMRAVA